MVELFMKDFEKEFFFFKEEFLMFNKKEIMLVDSNKQNECLQMEIKDLKLSINVYCQEILDKDGDIKRF